MTSIPGEPGANSSSGRLLAQYDAGETKAGEKGIQTFEQKNFFAKIFATVSRNLTSVIDPDTKELVVVDKKSLVAFLRRNQDPKDPKLKKSVGKEELFNIYMTFLSRKVWHRPKDIGIPQSLPTIHSGKITGTVGQFGDLFRALERERIAISPEILDVVAKGTLSELKGTATNTEFSLKVFANGLTIPDAAKRLVRQQKPIESEAAVGENVVSRDEIKDFIETMCNLQVEKLPEAPATGPAARSEKDKEPVGDKGDTLVGAAKIGLTAEQLRGNLAEPTSEELEDSSREPPEEDLEMDKLAALLKEKWTFGKEIAPPDAWKEIAQTIDEKNIEPWKKQVSFDNSIEKHDLLWNHKSLSEKDFVELFVAVASELNQHTNILNQLKLLPLRQQLYLCMAAYAKPDVVSNEAKNALFKNLKASIDAGDRTDEDRKDLTTYVSKYEQALRALVTDEEHRKVLGMRLET
jgi:hypothetical protein